MEPPGDLEGTLTPGKKYAKNQTVERLLRGWLHFRWWALKFFDPLFFKKVWPSETDPLCNRTHKDGQHVHRRERTPAGLARRRRNSQAAGRSIPRSASSPVGVAPLRCCCGVTFFEGENLLDISVFRCYDSHKSAYDRQRTAYQGA